MRVWIWRRHTLVGIFLGLFLLLSCMVFWQLHQQKSVFSAWETTHTLVIDAGHGGFDGGAVSANGTSEQHINLSIARRVQALAGLFGVSTIMTREDEQALDYDASKTIRENKVADIRQRQKITDSAANPIFVSIHLNKFPDTQYWGAQVFYSRNCAESQPLAQSLQQALASGLSQNNQRREKQAANTIYLMKQLQCPAVIVECGFLSNAAEEAKLQQEAYQTQIAMCICTGYLQHISAKDTKETL